ncbi:MAG: pimeloyl-ACP methyl ester esterase BioH [Gammaproteobacteria bacterium]|nr:pimeloyl-ACP methyl ester esterase BioH [Gammaproteobacteria bacterium]
MHSGVWDHLIPVLTKYFRITLIDLPGHGYNNTLSMPDDISGLAECVADSVSAKANWLGWSLGGMIAARVALDYPEKVRRMTLVASTPKFVVADDWRHAVSSATLDSFGDELQVDYKNTVRRFLSLQVLGEESAVSTLRGLRIRLFAHGEPHPDSLRAGLNILKYTDLRGEMRAIKCPVQMIAGERDRLTPPSASVEMSKILPGSSCHIIEKATHTPFISHPAEFTDLVCSFHREPLRQIS